MSTQPNPKAKGRAEAQDGPPLSHYHVYFHNRWWEKPIRLEPTIIGEAKMSNTNDIFDTFIKAKEALDRLPAAEQRINELEHSLAVCHDTTQAKDDTIDNLHNSINELEFELNAAKARIEELSFRELQARDSLETVLKTIGSSVQTLLETAKAADETVNPTPVSPPNTEWSSSGQDGSGDSGMVVGQQSSAESSGMPSVSSSFAEGQSEEGFTNTTNRNTGTFTPTSNTPMSISTDQSEVNPPQHSIDGGTQTGSEGPCADPFAFSTEGQSVPAEQLDTSATTMENEKVGSLAPQSADASQPKPHEGKHYWMKPTTMTWYTWRECGGIVPEWATDRLFSTN